MKLTGNVICVLGGVVWLIGYFAGGPKPLYAWPSWAFLPNLVAEIGAAVCILGAVLAYWPTSSKQSASEQ